VCPVISYVNNIGCDGSGSHCGDTEKFNNDLVLSKRDVSFIRDIKIDNKVIDSFRKAYRKTFCSKIKQLFLSYICGKNANFDD
jgi:hypothetical protein